MKFATWVLAGLSTLAPALAVAQGISVDVQRTGGLPQLDSNGNWVWEVYYDADADGGAAAIDLGFDFADADLVSGNVPLTGTGNGGVEVETVGRPVFGWETLGGGSGGQFALGFQLDASQGTNGQAFMAVGTGIVGASESLLIATFVTEGPMVGGSLTTTLSVTGAYNDVGDAVQILPGTHGLISQVDGSEPVAVSAMVTLEPAMPGDVNLDGQVDRHDLGIVHANQGLFTTAGWAAGDMNRSGVVDAVDLMIVSSQIPTPGSLLLLVATAGLLTAGRRRGS